MKLYKSEAGKKAIYDSYEMLVKMWGITTEERDLEGSYGKTHVILAGETSNPPLLLFHGVGDCAALMWVNNASELAKHFRIIAIDTMGGSGKSVPDERYNKDFDLGKWYGDILDGLGLDEVFAAGVSYGAYHCQLLIIRYPKRVKKIVGIAGYIAAAGYTGSKYSAILRVINFTLPLIFMPTRENVLRVGAKIMGMNYEELIANPEMAEHFWLMNKHYRMQSQFNHARRNFSHEEIDTIRNKSLFLIGDSDNVVTFPAAVRAQKDFKINQKIIRGAGHSVNYTKPREIENEIIDFCLTEHL